MPSVANYAAMCRLTDPTSNKLRAVNWPEWVFGGRVCGGLGDFAPGVAMPGADRWGAAGDSDRLQRLATEAGRSGSRPASIQQNQGFGAIRLVVVAPVPSHGAAGSAEISRSWGASRLIACLPTGSSCIAIGASAAPWLGQRPRGAVPPFGPRPAPYAGSGHRAGNLENSAPGLALHLGSGITPRAAGRKVWRCAMGSGVRAAPKRGRSGLRKLRRAGNRVGVATVHAGAWALGDSAVTVSGACC